VSSQQVDGGTRQGQLQVQQTDKGTGATRRYALEVPCSTVEVLQCRSPPGSPCRLNHGWSWLVIAAPIDIPRHHLLAMERCLHTQEVASAVRRS
jgi:hypothetical protein